MEKAPMTNPTSVEGPLTDVDRVLGEPWTELSPRKTASMKALIQAAYTSLIAHFPQFRTNQELRLPHTSRSTLRTIWGKDIGHHEYSPDQLLLLSRFDPIEVEAMHLTPEQVIAAFDTFIHKTHITIGDGAGEIPLNYAIHVFRLEYFDQLIIDAGASLEGSFSTLRGTPNQTIIAAAFGDMQARSDIQRTLGTEYAEQWNRFALVTTESLNRHFEMWGSNSVVTFGIPEKKDTNLQLEFLTHELERLIRLLEEELKLMLRNLDIVLLKENINVLLMRIRALAVKHNQASVLQNPVFIKAQNVLHQPAEREPVASIA